MSVQAGIPYLTSLTSGGCIADRGNVYVRFTFYTGEPAIGRRGEFGGEGIESSFRGTVSQSRLFDLLLDAGLIRREEP